MSYIVITRFADLADDKYMYEAGDKFPRDGMKVTKKRLQELSGKKNKARKPLIKEIEDDTDGDMSGTEELVRPESK